MADGVFQNMVEQAGLADQIQVDSAGTDAYHVGDTAHRGTLKKLQEAGIHYSRRARQVNVDDLDTFDYVLAMDMSHMSRLQPMTDGDKRAEVAMFLSYANEAGLTDTKVVIDPYYNNKFDEVYDLVQKGCKALLDHIRAEHNL